MASAWGDVPGSLGFVLPKPGHRPLGVAKVFPPLPGSFGQSASAPLCATTGFVLPKWMQQRTASE
jgi:hypothetical protein